MMAHPMLSIASIEGCQDKICPRNSTGRIKQIDVMYYNYYHTCIVYCYLTRKTLAVMNFVVLIQELMHLVLF